MFFDGFLALCCLGLFCLCVVVRLSYFLVRFEFRLVAYGHFVLKLLLLNFCHILIFGLVDFAYLTSLNTDSVDRGFLRFLRHCFFFICSGFSYFKCFLHFRLSFLRFLYISVCVCRSVCLSSLYLFCYAIGWFSVCLLVFRALWCFFLLS